MIVFHKNTDVILNMRPEISCADFVHLYISITEMIFLLMCPLGNILENIAARSNAFL